MLATLLLRTAVTLLLRTVAMVVGMAATSVIAASNQKRREGLQPPILGRIQVGSFCQTCVSLSKGTVASIYF